MKRVIAYDNIPFRLPIGGTATVWLLMDRFNPPGWVWGAMAVLVAIWWVVWLYAITHQKEVNLFPKDPEE